MKRYSIRNDEILEIQNKIVDILDKAQKLMDKRKEQIEALDELVKSNEENANFALLTESLVVYANRERYHLSDIKVLLNQVETSFFDLEFEKAYLDAGNTTKKLKHASNIEKE